MPAEIGSDSISKVEVTVKSYAFMNQSSGVLDRVDCCGAMILTVLLRWATKSEHLVVASRSLR